MNKKGSAIGYAGIFAMLIVTTFVFIYISGGEDVDATITSSDGMLISFNNEVELFLKSFNTGVEFIAQRAAYDLGMNGGMDRSAYWNEGYPSLDVLKGEVEKRINENMPALSTDESIEVTMGDAEITAAYTSECGPIEDSECFFVNGKVYMNFYDNKTLSSITLDPYEFTVKIPSNYFKLLNAGRSMFEETQFKDALGDHGLLRSRLNSAYPDLHFYTEVVEGNIIKVTIEEVCYPPGLYCIAPLKAGEEGFDEAIPYDNVKLVLNYNKEQTGFTDPGFDFTLYVTPPQESMVCS